MSLGGNAGGRAVEEATPEGGAGVEFTGLPSREAEFLWVDTDHRRSFGRLPRQVGFTVFFQNLGMAKGNYFPFFVLIYRTSSYLCRFLSLCSRPWTGSGKKYLRWLAKFALSGANQPPYTASFFLLFLSLGTKVEHWKASFVSISA